MDHSFELFVGKEASRLSLKKSGRELASRQWNEGRDMGRQLFESIDDILRERGLAPEDVGSFDVRTDVSDAFTSVKIAQTVAKTYCFAVDA